ncbi:hypothetical protein [Burkholderia pseudomallei]|uniref:hypothetical protein n=1 Tax=Burkholderia pseudomallei TaxID=28450 RepID=UPI00097693F6|nr:hypothetical protein [Burkholderia pseudomallei]OMQ57098.1 hypothetical protein AQ709_26735 [Burkholderia pseudomallei]OMQ65164.1 hypothetical protein AQ712_13145 [Burkholderia pseudomallei]OMQ72895.1 hypothetical protein AQ711_02605 [Burkholderia pseudomallei]CAJ2717894.1 Uncharacterised protein [Burkholderia pseudomallei]CAJ4669058.1 Uncharacterised protein [Burkholderia pseudomallei]
MNAPAPLHIDPVLDEVFELLHRMTICNEDTPATRYAGEALRKLRKYEDRVRSAQLAGSK